MWNELHQRSHCSSITIPDWLAIRQPLYWHELSGPTLAQWAVFQGAQSQSLSLAFLWGYQAAMRCVDPHLPSQQLAAWCVSERGLSSLRAMSTEYDPVAQTLSGHKSHVMLMESRQLDTLYVLARLTGSESLVAVRVSADAPGISVHAATKPQPFVSQVPHAAVTFSQTPVHPDFYVEDAHARLNRPFRLWEDCFVSCAFAGWFWQQLPTALRPIVEQSVDAWLQHLDENDRQYDVQHLQLGSALFAQLNALSTELSAAAALQWNQDKTLLLLGERARQTLRQRFAVASSA